MPGKVSPEDLCSVVFSRTGREDDRVLQGPADGEDAAAIDVPAGTLVVSSDPISLAASAVGQLGVHVACNDVAASGGEPRWLTVVCLLPSDADDGMLERITGDLDAEARNLGATVVGGHTEVVDALTRPLLSMTAIGTAETFVPTGGAQPGDRLLLTDGAGIEGTAILAGDFGSELDVDPAIVDRGRRFLDDLSVLPAARVLRTDATAMHDPTEGGVAAAAHEIARAADVAVTIDRAAVPIEPETDTLCAAAHVDPLKIFGSGSLLATVPPNAVEGALDRLAEAGIEAAEVGTVEAAPDGPHLVLDHERITDPVEDDLYPLWERADT